MSKEPDCAILVPVLNEEQSIKQSAAAMERQRFSGQIEVLFADGGSTDRTREILEGLADNDLRIRVLDNPGGTVTSGLNVALRHTRARWVARMDAHTVYPDDYVAQGIERLEQGGTRWVSGPPLPRGRGRVSRAVELALGSPLGRGRSRKWDQGDGSEFELDSGVFCGVWERGTLLEYGGWDEGWICNEDSEMAGRFLARGEALVCVPEMAAEYAPRDSLLALWRQYERYGEYRAKTANRHPRTLRRSNLLPPGIVLAAGAAIAGHGAVGRGARCVLALYGASLSFAGVRSAPRSERWSDVALVPVVLATMHFAHGIGMLKGVRRHGAPLAALAEGAGLRGLAKSLARPPEPVFAPSLDGRASPRHLQDNSRAACDR